MKSAKKTDAKTGTKLNMIPELKILQDAFEKIQKNNELGKGAPTDGKWLEELTIDVATLILEWDIEECWHWSKWPDLKTYFPSTSDIGIDVVGRRRGDGGLVAIQCKSRQLNEKGVGKQITKKEIDSFSSLSSGEIWTERWIVTHGEVELAKNAMNSVPKEKPIRQVHLLKDIQQQLADSKTHHVEREINDDGRIIQTRSSMQDEAVSSAVEGLRRLVETESGGLPIGKARGRIVLPCGTGKTRIALRIVEELAEIGGLAIVLCPSIALVAQLRREFLQNTRRRLRTLSVCSDETAGVFQPEDTQDRLTDPTVDMSYVSASEIKGMVTTDAQKISDWIQNTSMSLEEEHLVRDGIPSGSMLNIIFGTYQSSHRIGEALRQNGSVADVLIADEAHRTAGLKKASKPNVVARLKDFTVCHDDDRFPVKYRIYQTATPRVYENRTSRNAKKTEYVVRSMDDESVFGVLLYRRSYTDAVKNEWLTDYRIIALGVNDKESFDVANEMANRFDGKRNSPTTTTFLRGLVMALVMGGGLRERVGGIRSCIAFLNTVRRSEDMTKFLESAPVQNWVTKRVGYLTKEAVSTCSFQHLDASSSVIRRDHAKADLGRATASEPRAILNVGIFGEGTDAPSLGSVAFLEPRRSPIDVIQAVGRAMRLSKGKKLGYIIVPIHIPPNVNAEDWLSTAKEQDGWSELGQILRALRSHDGRIETDLSDLLEVHVPTSPEKVSTMVGLAKGGG